MKRTTPNGVVGASDRQLHGERGAPCGPVRDADPAAHAGHDGGRDGESQAGAAAGRCLGPPEPVEDVGQVLRPHAGPLVLHHQLGGRTARGAPAPAPRPPSGLWRTALSTRMVTTWRSRSGSPDDHHRLRVDLDAHTPGGRGRHHRERGIGGDVAQLDRLEGHVQRPRVGARQEQQVLHQRGEVADLRVDVVERGAHLRDGLVLVQSQVLDAGADDGQRRPQLVARVGRELALAPQCLALRVQRRPDGHQGARRVGGTQHAREHQRQHATTDEHLEQRIERVSCSAVRSWTTWMSTPLAVRVFAGARSGRAG